MFHCENYYPVFNYQPASVGSLFKSVLRVVNTIYTCNKLSAGPPIVTGTGLYLACPRVTLEAPLLCATRGDVWDLGVLT